MTLTTRKPTGRPAWPMILIAGVEKAGKSYACAAASGSDLVDRTFWISFGEDDPDEMAPLGRFEIVQHDDTYRGLLAVLDAIEQEPVGDKPHLIVFDSVTKLWDLLCDEAQVTANRRAARKAAKYNRAAPVEDAAIGTDLWNTAKQRWAHVIRALKDHPGPVLLTARLDEVVVMQGDTPTKDRIWKVKAEKTLPYDVGAIVQLRGHRDAYLTGVRSMRYDAPPDAVNPYPGFTVAGLWERLGLADSDTRSHSMPNPEASVDADEQPEPQQRPEPDEKDRAATEFILSRFNGSAADAGSAALEAGYDLNGPDGRRGFANHLYTLQHTAERTQK